IGNLDSMFEMAGLDFKLHEVGFNPFKPGIEYDYEHPDPVIHEVLLAIEERRQELYDAMARIWDVAISRRAGFKVRYDNTIRTALNHFTIVGKMGHNYQVEFTEDGTARKASNGYTGAISLGHAGFGYNPKEERPHYKVMSPEAMEKCVEYFVERGFFPVDGVISKPVEQKINPEAQRGQVKRLIELADGEASDEDPRIDELMGLFAEHTQNQRDPSENNYVILVPTTPADVTAYHRFYEAMNGRVKDCLREIPVSTYIRISPTGILFRFGNDLQVMRDIRLEEIDEFFDLRKEHEPYQEPQLPCLDLMEYDGPEIGNTIRNLTDE
ncbi:hypothetical protein ACFL0V_07400, partial [Nanoarchaeota archaeon]